MISALFVLIAIIGCGYLLCAAAVARLPKVVAPQTPAPPVTILKPLNGDEPDLFENLASFCAQDYPAPVQIICGVQHPQDTAIATVERLQISFPNTDLQLVLDTTSHGTNPKIANLINMARYARYEHIVLADSDIRVTPNYVAEVLAPLTSPGVGAVTCLYHGRVAAGFWARLSALAIDTHFLPNVLLGLRIGLATPTFGSTIALTRSRLSEIGGFEAFADCLADDYGVGAALRARGLRVETANLAVAHSCSEPSFLDLLRHELRWARTIRSIEPSGYVGSLITHPLGWALLAATTGAPRLGAAAAALAVACRILLLCVVARNFRLAASSYWLTPVRDFLSFAVFVWSFLGTDLTWRGRNYRVQSNGTLTADETDENDNANPVPTSAFVR